MKNMLSFTKKITVPVAVIFFTILSPSAFSQDLLEGLEEEPTDYAIATFKSTRVINGHSVENVAGGVLDFRISHRFGVLDQGLYDMFGLDVATMRLGFEYGINDKLMVGLGRNTYQKSYDGFVKYKILRQSTGKKNMPVTATYLGAMTVNTLKWEDPTRENYFTSRLNYVHQILIGRKFSSSTSIQLSPTLVHRNLVTSTAYKNDVFAIGIGGRQKINNRVSFNAEYFYVLPNQIDPTYKNSLSVGFDIETGGHVFQLHFTNSTPQIEKGFITETTGSWLKKGIHFGFNISRVFTVGKRTN
jgi:hypothetical protein